MSRELVDWRAVLAHVRADGRIDRGAVAVWGSSLGGGHALTIAAEDHDLDACVAQVPHCDSRAAFALTPRRDVIRSSVHALVDRLAGIFGGCHTMAVVGPPGSSAVMNHPGWMDGYLAMVPPESAWRNAIPARSLLLSGNYRPVESAQNIRCPTPIVYGTLDAGVPVESVFGLVYPFDGDHFAVYEGAAHERCVAAEADFLRRHLLR